MAGPPTSGTIGPAIPPWKQFPFFEVEQIKDVNDLASTPEVFRNPAEISTSSSSTAGILVADIYGNIHVLNKDFESIKSWLAHPSGRVTHMIDRKGFLVTIGEEESVPSPLLKIWDLGKTDKKTGIPILLRSTKIQHGSRPHPVSSIALSPSLSHLAIGLADGTVLLYRQLDQYLSPSGSLTSLPKARTVHESPTEPITGLGFREPSPGDEAPVVHLFIVTTNRVLCYKASGRGTGAQPVEVDEKGAALGCAVMDWKGKEIVLARTEAIFLCGTEGRGASLAYEGPKSSVHTHLNYLVIVSPPFVPNSATQSATVRNFVARTPLLERTDVSKVTVFDIENKFVAYSGTFVDGVRDVMSEWGNVFVVTNDGKLWRLEERPTPEKLDMIYRKGQYQLALNLAKTQGLDASSVADIHRQYGDHLYVKADYDGAMAQYVKTIGHLQPSYVIRKFLDTQRIHNLVTYLQDLHSLGLANSDHTTLLLNTYTKLKDVSRLDSFIKTESRRSSAGADVTDDDEPPFDLETAIRVCRQAGYFDHASYLAKKYKRHEDYLRIQIEDAGNYRDALAYVRRLDLDATEGCLTRYGRLLLSNLPDETTQLLIDICTTGTSPPQTSADAEASASAKGSGFAAPSYLSYLALNRGIAAPSPAPAVTPTITTSSADTAQPTTPTTAKAASEVSSTTGGPVSKRTRTASTQDQSTPRTGSPVAGSMTITVAPLNVRPRAEKRPSPRLYFAHFVENLDKFVVFLEAIALKLWGQSVDEGVSVSSTEDLGRPLPYDEEEDKRDQTAVWNTLLELYLTLSTSDTDPLRSKALHLLENKSIPYDTMHALTLCSTQDFTPGLVLLWEKLGMYEDVLRFWMDRDRDERESGSNPNTTEASCKVIHYLTTYGPNHGHLYPLVLRFLTSSPELLQRHAKELAEILDVIQSEKIMPPLAVVQILSRNGVTSVGLVKEWLLKRISEAKEEVQTDRQLINSYRDETATKLKQVEELSDPQKPRVFHVTRCSICNTQLDLPSVHFMCNHSYHQRCLAENETECPNCVRTHGMIREIRRNNERLAGQHDLFLSEVREGGFAAVATGFGRGMMRMQRIEDVSN